MANGFYDHTTYPATSATLASSPMRSELDSIEAGFDKLPTMAGNGGAIVAVNSGATALEAITTTGTGSGVRATSPTLVTPTIGVATATSVTAGTVYINRSSDGQSIGNISTTGAEIIYNSTQGAGHDFRVIGASRAFVSATGLAVTGTITATSVNKVAVTAPATAATLTLAEGSTLATSGAFSATLTSTATTNVTLPTTGTLSTLAGAESLSNKTLVAPVLGTPASGTLTNCAGLPAEGVSGTALVSAAIGTTVQAYDADLTTWAGITPGTGVATALAVAVGSEGAPVVNGGALGTPASGVMTNVTGTAAGLTAGAVTNGVYTTDKDASGGVAGLTLFKLNLRNAANTFTSWLTNTATAARTWAMQDRDGTVALVDDITGGTRAGSFTTLSTGVTGTAGTVYINRSSDGQSIGNISTTGAEIIYNSTQGAGHDFQTLGVSRAFVSTTGLAVTGAITATSNILVAAAGGQAYLTSGFDAAGSAAVVAAHVIGSASGNKFGVWYYDGTVIGTISQSGTTAVAYNTTSDHRLKKNIRPANAARFMDIEFVDYEWIDGRHDCGLIADQLQSIYPDLVLGEKDATEIRQVEITPAVPAVVEKRLVSPAIPAVAAVEAAPAVEASPAEYATVTTEEVVLIDGVETTILRSRLVETKAAVEAKAAVIAVAAQDAVEAVYEDVVITPAISAVTADQTFPVYQQVNYTGLIGRMGTRVQQLQRIVDSQAALIAAMEARLTTLEAA